MIMKKFTRYLIYLLSIFIIMMITEMLYTYLLIGDNSAYIYFSLSKIIRLIGYIFIGFLISIRAVYLQHEKNGMWKVNKDKIFLLFIPSIILAIIPIEYIFLATTIDISHLTFNNLIVFGILSGYILSNSLYKDI